MVRNTKRTSVQNTVFSKIGIHLVVGVSKQKKMLLLYNNSSLRDKWEGPRPVSDPICKQDDVMD